jgi:hypothetical protein
MEINMQSSWKLNSSVEWARGGGKWEDVHIVGEPNNPRPGIAQRAENDGFGLWEFDFEGYRAIQRT